MVSVKGRDPEGYYQLSRTRVERPTDWASLEKAFADKATIVGTVTGVIKGGVTVDVGVRAFMPASRSGTRDASELEKLVEQEIRCRIIKLDVADEDIVVDRRAVLEEEERSVQERRVSELKEGSTVTGTVRTSRTMAPSSISAASTPYCTSATFLGAASESPPMSLPPETRWMFKS